MWVLDVGVVTFKEIETLRQRSSAGSRLVGPEKWRRSIAQSRQSGSGQFMFGLYQMNGYPQGRRFRFEDFGRS
jgi:hypothetical protein